MRILVQVVEFLAGPLAKRQLVEWFDVMVLPVVDHPRLGGAGVHIRVDHERVVRERLEVRRRRTRVVEAFRVAHRPAIRLEVDDVDEIPRAQRPLRIRQVALARTPDMTLAPGHHVIPLRIDLAAARIGQNRHQALAGHGRRDVDATCLAERGSEVHQVHEVRDGAPR